MWSPELKAKLEVKPGAENIVLLFNQTFLASHHTQLVGGADEPLYEIDKQGLARIHFCHDYISSALHEIAHWCIAGAYRRTLNDYGYWYEGTRDICQQQKFEKVEVQPQALEWIFSEALGIPFRVSVDNLELTDHDSTAFRLAVSQAAQDRIWRGLRGRAKRFARALQCKAEGHAYDKLGLYQRLPN
tara:strand:- start:8434 stop:8994 length:561 start_codon:yes stop_codon:yes gene_type:complete